MPSDGTEIPSDGRSYVRKRKFCHDFIVFAATKLKRPVFAMPLPRQIKAAARVLLYDQAVVTQVEIRRKIQTIFGERGLDTLETALGAMIRSHRISEKQPVSRRGSLLFAPDTPLRLHWRAREEALYPKAKPKQTVQKPLFSAAERREIARTERAYYRARERARKKAAGTYRKPGRPRKASSAAPV